MQRLLQAMTAVPVLLAMLAGEAAGAPPDAEVEALQMPAWILRDGKRVPLAPGAQLRNGDRIDTGVGSRALLRLADGSTVKLGEKTRFALDGLTGARRLDALFRATLDVLEGAFRFTTTSLYKFRGQRDIAVRFPTVTAGIRGTDVWGKATADREIVVLIDGKITVARRGEPSVLMDQPKSLYQALRNAGVLPVEQISDEALGRYAAETEIAPGQGVVGKSGRWRVYATRTRSQDEALAVYDRLREAGYPAEIQPTQKDGTKVYQVRIGGLLSEADGVTVAIKLKSELGLQDVSVSLI